METIIIIIIIITKETWINSNTRDIEKGKQTKTVLKLSVNLKITILTVTIIIKKISITQRMITATSEVVIKIITTIIKMNRWLVS